MAYRRLDDEVVSRIDLDQLSLAACLCWPAVRGMPLGGDDCVADSTRVNCPIMPLSSCWRMWQWYMYGVVGSAWCPKVTATLAVLWPPTNTVSFHPLA